MTEQTKEKVRNIGKLIVFIVKISAASGIAWELAKLAGSKHPYLAPLSVILCVQTTVFQSIRYSFHRLLGTVLGVTLTLWAAGSMVLNGWTLALLLALVCGFGLLIDRTESVMHEVALSVLLVFALQKQSDLYGLDRIRDTFIGLGVGLAVHMLIYPPNFVKPAERKALALMKSLSERFAEAADWIQSGCSDEQKKAVQSALRTFGKNLFQLEKQMEQAAESIQFNVTAPASQVLMRQNLNRIAMMKQGTAYLENTLNVVSEWNSTGTLGEPERKQWAGLLRTIGLYWINPSPKAADLSVSSLELRRMDAMPDEPLRYSSAIFTDTSALLKQLYRLS
ncbi:FUSC family protein [Paenibacillus macerans]|uniref:Fusaric acid resistance family protein n=1 Tax=Paenibacillus macerans TaxID=44252 RepID=A0A090ZXK9_PAEMA|nr:FUSC family protein [Paenibacillus macerans]KFN08871.1 fusaric acid resistance family protein [Paenibacillus macerans]MCY7559433.1 FUSC family protein [Paenibacillus macerans]MEC0154932.1 FUSC family protein [Paenibacillus macerans]MEC0330762.1 FUSC family protein [Paenibacillus macerans]SUA83247.1 Predicted membrane protein [Paenibacillus macerans]